MPSSHRRVIRLYIDELKNPGILLRQAYDFKGFIFLS